MAYTTKVEYLEAWARAKYYRDEEAFAALNRLILKHFLLIEHMRETSLYDVYEYEERIYNKTVEPMNILVHENETLKAEVNKLRKQLKLSEKYKVDESE